MRWVIGAALLVFTAAYLRIQGIDPRVQVRRRWIGGLVSGALPVWCHRWPPPQRTPGAGGLWSAPGRRNPECRGPALMAPLIGNAIITLSYLATGNPIATVLSHVVMHCAAVVHGMATIVQLPPHY